MRRATKKQPAKGEDARAPEQLKLSGAHGWLLDGANSFLDPEGNYQHGDDWQFQDGHYSHPRLLAGRKCTLTEAIALQREWIAPGFNAMMAESDRRFN